MELFKQITNNYSEEQMKSIWENAKRFGMPNEAIQQIQQEIKK